MHKVKTKGGKHPAEQHEWEIAAKDAAAAVSAAAAAAKPPEDVSSASRWMGKICDLCGEETDASVDELRLLECAGRNNATQRTATNIGEARGAPGGGRVLGGGEPKQRREGM